MGIGWGGSHGPGTGSSLIWAPHGPGILTYMGPPNPSPSLGPIPGPRILTYMGPPGPGILTYMGPPGPGILTYMGPLIPPHPWAPSLGPGSSLIWASLIPPHPWAPSLGPIPGAQFDKNSKVRETSKELSPEFMFYTEMYRISVRTTLVFTPKVDIP